MGFKVLLVVMVLAATSFAALAGVADASVVRSGGAAGEEEHRSAPDPVRVELATPSPVLVGVPVRLEATLTATWRALEDVRVTLEAAEGIVVTGGAESTVDLARDVPTTLVFTLTPATAGTHEVRVSAVAEVAHGHLGGERVGFLVVPKLGLGAFHQDVLPSDGEGRLRAVRVAEPAGGPLSLGAGADGAGVGAMPATAPVVPDTPPTDAEPIQPVDGGAERSGIGTLSHAQFQVRLCWFYENEASPPVDTPQRGATIQVYDDEDFGDQLLAEGVTGADGCYLSPPIDREDAGIGSGNQDVIVQIHLCDTWVCTYDSDDDAYVFEIDHGEIGGEDVLDFGNLKPSGGANFGARAFQYAYNGAWFTANKMNAAGFSNSGPQVELEAPSGDGSCDDGGMFFRRAENTIFVCSDSDRSPEDVGHEFGHWMHWFLYGQNNDAWPSPGGAHQLCQDNQNRGLSWTEGWGNFYGPRIGLEVPAPGADGNGNYDRPWNGASFSIDMESGGSCAAGVVGDDNEMNVAHAIWDVRDVNDDGTDTGSADGSFLTSVVAACDNTDFRNFFDGGCSWTSRGGDPCTFVRAAFNNRIDYNANIPTVSMTSQGSFSWNRGAMPITANAADADGICGPAVEFRVSHDATCDQADTLAGIDAFSPYLWNFQTAPFGDDASVWTCGRATDGMEPSGWVTSASHVGIDNTPPVTSVGLDGTLGNEGWYVSGVTVTLPCTDNLSGVAGISYTLDGVVHAYGGPFLVTGQGSHTLSTTCSDNAGNTDSDGASFKIDTLDPATLTSQSGPTGENGWYVGDVTVGMACTDPIPGSGCAFTEVARTFPDGTGGTFLYTAPFVVTGDGRHTIGYHSADVAGNTETPGSFEVAIDTLPPTGEIVSVSDGDFTHTGAYALGGLFTNEPTMVVTYAVADAASGIQWVSVVGGEVDAYSGPLTATGTLTLTLTPGITTWTLVVEDMAGHTAEFGTFRIAYVPHDAHPTVDPRSSGWWRNADKLAYTSAQLDAMLPLINVGSHAFGTPDGRYAELTSANYGVYLTTSPLNTEERVRKELTGAWLNLASGREPAAQEVHLTNPDWMLVVKNTGGTGTTTAMNVVLECEARLREGPTSTMLSSIKNVLAALNAGGLNN